MMSDESQHDSADQPDVGHIVGLGKMLIVIIALLALTWLTVFAAGRDLGPMSVWVAIIIAGFKVLIVVTYFMHLRYDDHFHGVIFCISLVFVVLFIGLLMMDRWQYQDRIDAYSSVKPVIGLTQSP
jgi:cytochrome c oxidase subunit 4